MYKINKCESDREFWRQNSSFSHENKIEFMKKQLAITNKLWEKTLKMRVNASDTFGAKIKHFSFLKK